jgi:hypothetical protein
MSVNMLARSIMLVQGMRHLEMEFFRYSYDHDLTL